MEAALFMMTLTFSMMSLSFSSLNMSRASAYKACEFGTYNVAFDRHYLLVNESHEVRVLTPQPVKDLTREYFFLGAFHDLQSFL